VARDLGEQQQKLGELIEEATTSRDWERQIREWLLLHAETMDDSRLTKAEDELAGIKRAILEKRKEEEPFAEEEETYRSRVADLKAKANATKQATNEIPNDHRAGVVQDWSLVRAKAAYRDAKVRMESAQTEESLALFATREERRKIVNRAKAELQRFCTATKVEPDRAIQMKLATSYEEASLQVNRELNEAKRRYHVAEHEVSQARDAANQHPMPAAYQPHHDDVQPGSAAQGRDLMADVKTKVELGTQHVQDADNALQELGHQMVLLGGQRKEVGRLQEDWKGEEDVSALAWIDKSLPETDAALEFARRALDDYRRTRRRFTTAKQNRDSAYKSVDEESRKRAWDRVDADKRHAVQQGPDSLTEIAEAVLREYRTWRDVITDSLQRADAAVGQITARLTTLVKSDGLAIIHHSPIGSRLPHGSGAWSERPFLKIELSGGETRNLSAADIEPYCKQVVRNLLSDEQAFDGRELIIRVLDELAGTDGYRVTILKPSHTLIAERHDIKQLASWSDGEIITAAIVLYCCIVQARTWHRTGASRSTRQQSNGILLLDNPFGEANSPDFVQLQVDMAQKLGVQLIYTASGDPRELLAMFRRNNRLYQRHGKGVKHVGVEDVTVDEIAVGRGTVALKHG